MFLAFFPGLPFVSMKAPGKTDTITHTNTTQIPKRPTSEAPCKAWYRDLTLCVDYIWMVTE